jgi:hypothetical protein
MNVRNSTMSLRCSLLGHDYGDAEIEREREEQGSEVVVTVREFEECSRCGARSVISENKEVRALDSPAPDLASAESSELVDSSGPSASTGAEASGDVAGVDAEGDDAEILTDSGTAESSQSVSSSQSSGSGKPSASGQSSRSGQPNSSGQQSGSGQPSADPATETGQPSPSGQSAESGDADAPDEPAGPSADGEADAEQSAAEDDGVILDDEQAPEPSDDRRPGEWPEAEATHSTEAAESEHEPWPDVGQKDEGFDAEPGGGSADVEFGGGLTPESAPEVEDGESEVEFVNAEGDRLEAPESEQNDPEPELSSGISARAEAPSVSGPADDPDVDAEFVCPECEYREGVAGSSLRAGDICPECARGYLARQ